jgi:hypothetical protein
VEVHRRIARIVRRNGVLAILALITLHTRPRFQKRSIHGEVPVREQTPLPRLLEHSFEEGFGNVPIEPALAVFREHGHLPNAVIHIQAHEPAEQQVVVDLFHQHASAVLGAQRTTGSAGNNFSGAIDGRPVFAYSL